MSKWKLCSREKPKKEGVYLVVNYCPDDETDNTVFPSIVEWHFAGDVITYHEPEGNTPEERLRFVLTHGPVRAQRDGFYEVGDGKAWLLAPYMWRELPRPPAGMDYYDIHLDD